MAEHPRQDAYEEDDPALASTEAAFAADDPGGADEPSLQELLDAERDRSLRLQAELQNVLNRKARELAEERRYAALPVIRDVLPVLDNIDRAIGAAEKNADAAALLEGFRLVRQQLLTAFAQHGCEGIQAVGQQFNPDRHSAILQQPSDEHPAGVVILDAQAGYVLADRVVRPSQVIVSSGPAGAAD